MHHRLEPKQHQFVYNIFMFCLDLDEIDSLSGRFWLFSRNRFNIFNFRDSDHLEFSGANVKENIHDYLRRKGVEIPNGKILLITHLRTFGYIFNPVSFYFCFDQAGKPVCCVPEIGNTFREIKPFFLGLNDLNGSTFRQRTKKYFYVSPFIDLDAVFDFHLAVPSEKLNFQINDYQDDKKFFVSSMTGDRKELTNWRLIWYTLRFPLITLKVISAIHWQAFRLWLKGLPYHRKIANLELQQGVTRGKSAY